MKKLPNDFFSKIRPNTKELSEEINQDDKIIPFKWSKDVLNGKFRDKSLLTLPNSK